MGDEEELLAHYLSNNRSFDHFQAGAMVLVEEGCWKTLIETSHYKEKKAADELSYKWDRLMETIYSTGSPLYEKVAREFARANRLERRFLVEAFMDAQKKACQIPMDSFRRIVGTSGATYLFLFEDDTSPHTSRLERLKLMCEMVRGLYPIFPKVLGIATDQHFCDTSHVDFCLFEQVEWTEEDDKRIKAMQERTGFQTNVTRSERTIRDFPNSARD